MTRSRLRMMGGQHYSVRRKALSPRGPAVPTAPFQRHAQQLFDQVPECILVLQLDGRIVHANAAAVAMYGYAYNDLCAMRIHDLRDPSTMPDLAWQLAHADAVGMIFETVHQRRDGSSFPVEVHSQSAQIGESRLLISSIRDCSGRHRANGEQSRTGAQPEALGRRQVENTITMHARVLESMTEGVSISDSDGIILYTNPAEDVMFGYERGELIGQHVSVQNTYPPEENARIVRDVIARLHAHGAWQGEFRNRKKDGTPFTTFARITALQIDQRSYWVCVQEDMTEFQQIAAELRSSQARLALAYDAAKLGTFDWNIRTSEVRWSAEEEALYGLPPGGFGGAYADWRAIIHPDDRDRTDQVVGQSAAEGTDLDTEFRVLWPDGSVHWLSAKARVLRDRNGVPLRMIGVNEDITARKRREQAQHFLAEAGALLATSLDEHAVREQVVHLTVPTYADSCVMYLWQEGERVERVAVAHADPAKEALLLALGSDFPLDADADAPIMQVLRGGASHLEQHVDAAMPHVSAGSIYADLLGSMGARSYLLVPMRVGTRTIGVLLLAMADSLRQYQAEDLAFAEELAGRAALAIDNARLYAAAQEAIRREQQRVAQLHGLTEASLAINAALSLDASLQVITDQARALIGAHQAVCSMTADESWAQAINAVSLSDKYAAYRTYQAPVVGAGIYAWVCRNNQPIRMTQAELEAHPEWRGFSTEAPMHPPMRGWLAVPLVGKDGRNIGIIQLSDKLEGEFTAEDEVILVQLAQLAVVAIENVRLYHAAQEAIALRDVFFTVAAHELKTPLTSLLGQAQLLQRRLRQEQGQSERFLRSAEVIVNQARRLNELIVTMLDIARLEQGRLSIASERLDLCALTYRVVDEIQPTMGRHRLIIEAGAPSLVILGDALRLEQVLHNLIENAVKYSPDGGHVTIRLLQDGVTARVEIHDQGIGIPQEAIPQLFQQFYRAHNATVPGTSGMGIGLYVVKEIVQLHGGRVEVASAEGRGSTFTVVMPLAPEPPMPLE